MLVCELCPKSCHIEEGALGDCGIRANLEGRLRALTYGHPCAVNVDPVEKKPLYHFLPGSGILSVATVGCNLSCRGCQNWAISQARVEEAPAYSLLPAELPALLERDSLAAVAYTYTEPLAWYEYTLDCCQAVKDRGYRNVLVTAGYLNEKPLRRLLPLVDAANVDLKALDAAFYRDWCGGDLGTVLRNLRIFKELGVWLELTNLVVPGMNDSDAGLGRLVDWVLANLGDTTPLHFSRFYPRWRAENLPPTPTETLERARTLALKAGLRFVYVGNVRQSEGERTYCVNATCPGRQRALIRRSGYVIEENRLRDGACPDCGSPLPGVWKP